ncbi:PDDEXK nuclease domain-containing protein [Chryseobacterium sp. JJR-5R]|uniref:PDDEXK nuclease domain-containing protein n=1 Tax=Chryseobacterium sp. JJR-5R TaxID=3093923 RepID=UPI002A76411F|nr:PDDEXK nuclease domain-containing protein [Chryseobacterium sp. JJR-5R]WPO84206.1 PDDEXK nuclease domain-containing protein [Chryseobacterium sp. JJR-5R]
MLQNHQQLLTDLKKLVDMTRGQVAVKVNTAMVVLYWKIGQRINEDVLGNKRAEYGKDVILHISRYLTVEFGSSFSEKNIRKMMQFASVFDNFEIVASAMRQLSWTHFLLLIPISQETKRNFYLEICKIENWSVRTLREKINSMLFERTAISKKPEQIIGKELKNWSENNILNPDLVFKDPYFLDFLELKDTFSEKDLEESIIVELQKFISELGSDFAFLSRQKRITIDNRDYYMDLLFYHRKLKSLVVIELKLGEFEASHKGQMELYLSYLNKYEKIEGENPPIGLILCSGKNSEHIELMNLEADHIKVAEYFIVLPPKKVLLEKLHRSIEIAKNKFENK